MNNFNYLNHRIKDLKNVKIGDVDITDWPKFSGAYLESASLDDKNLTEDELNYISENFYNWINNQIFESFSV